jgi:uncharacterized protein
VTIDVHVHISALARRHGFLSRRLLGSVAFRFMKWRMGLVGADETTEVALRNHLFRLLDTTPELDAAVVLAFDGVHDRDGRFDAAKTHLYVTNDYVIELAKSHRKVLFGASIHPYRVDATAELERCVRAGAALVKWLPPTQGMNPADQLCLPFYEAMAHFEIPLLCHTGGEQSLPSVDRDTRSPMLLKPALDRGVTVIAAHCGTRSTFWEEDYLDEFTRLCHEYEHFYGDTAALNLPTRSHAYRRAFDDKVVMSKLLHGSDWPIFPVPPATQLENGLIDAAELWTESNWLRRDLLIKKKLGFDEAYWQRASSVLRLTSSPSTLGEGGGEGQSASSIPLP